MYVIPPFARESAAATPELPLPPAPAGKATDVPVPTLVFRAHLGEVVGEVVGRPARVGAVDRSDLRVRQLCAGIAPGNCRIVPRRDFAEEDVGEDLPAQLQVLWCPRDVVRDRRPRQRPRNLKAAFAGLLLVRRERRIARTEVDRPVCDLLDSTAAADRPIRDRGAVPLRVVRNPLRDQREHERRPGAYEYPAPGLRASSAATPAAGECEDGGSDDYGAPHIPSFAAGSSL
jgi:hypothetical protein